MDMKVETRTSTHGPSQRSLHNAPIFRLLLKVAVNGTHQCDFLNFCGTLVPISKAAPLVGGSGASPMQWS